MQLLGFNCLRLPFSFQNLFETTPTVFTKACTPTTTADIQADVTDPSVSVPAGKTIPAQVLPCNCCSQGCIRLSLTKSLVRNTDVQSSIA